MEIFYSFFVFSLILSSSYAAVQDFCVADYAAPSGPAGYSCKRPETVTVDSFVYSGLGVAGNTSNIFGVAFTKASCNEVPSLNGLGVSMARIDLAPGGVVPLHTHPGTSEIVYLLKGKLIAGFISSDTNKVYTTTIKSGDAFVIPQGLLHFFVNIGGPADNPVVAFSAYSSSNVPVQIVDFALFKSSFPSDLISPTTKLSANEIRRMKALFGGTN